MTRRIEETMKLKTAVQAAELLSPVGEIELVDMGLAERPADLNGLRIAFLDNSRPKADLFLARVEELLAQRYKFAQVLHLRKNTASSPHPDLPAVIRSADMVVEAFAQ